MIKNLVIAVVGIIFASLLYIAFVPATSPFVNGPTPIACTQEAKLCPDGSAVGRTGPKCEFAECPPSSTVTYNCAGGRSLVATFGASMVGLQLPDGRTFLLSEEQTVEGERAFFTIDGAFSFWARDYSAFFLEDGVETFSACVVADLTYP
mgnify:CR=1 FL=1